MSYIVMARKWRPRNFETLVGQEHVVRTLKNAIQANRISHAYLFTGPRGVGKTTTARLLAKVANCLSPVEGEPCNHCVRCEEIQAGSATDVIEIDAASNGLVDDARELREKVRYAPVSCRYKVIVIDEVHMMSNAAFNALLKTLEEPPAHTIFILATTESHKVPATIISRCQRFDFRRIPEREITERLAVMAAAEGVSIQEEALHVIARGAEGSLRDAQSLFDQIISFSGTEVKTEDVVTVLGLVDTQVFIALVDAVTARKATEVLRIVDTLVNSGADLRLFMKEWVEYWRQLVIARVAGRQQGNLEHLPSNVAEAVERQSLVFSLEELLNVVKLAAATDDELRRTQHPRLLLELLLLQLCSANRLVSFETLWGELQAMEARVAKMPAAVQSQADQEGPEETPPVAQPACDGEENAASAVAGEPALVVDSLEELDAQSYVETVREIWPAMVQTIGQKNRRVQALLRDVVITAAEEGWVELTCASAYHLTGLEKEEARKLIETVFEGQLGKQTRLQLKHEEKSAPLPEEGLPRGADRQKEFEDISHKEPLVQKTLEMFGGQIIDILQKPSAGGNK
ncbi:DNA polymerase III subunit gamma/tau [candidate division FCPU426 bacterium]|nr:DNA polymerase III subunit gamma/tau [candidate division FCPU426 bacterium]